MYSWYVLRSGNVSWLNFLVSIPIHSSWVQEVPPWPCGRSSAWLWDLPGGIHRSESVDGDRHSQKAVICFRGHQFTAIDPGTRWSKRVKDWRSAYSGSQILMFMADSSQRSSIQYQVFLVVVCLATKRRLGWFGGGGVHSFETDQQERLFPSVLSFTFLRLSNRRFCLKW